MTDAALEIQGPGLVGWCGRGTLSAGKMSLGAYTLQRANAGLRAGGRSPSMGKALDSICFYFDAHYPASDHYARPPGCRTTL